MWTVVETSLKELGNLDISEFSKRYRSNKPVVVHCRFNLLPWTCLVKCAPLDTALCATADWTLAIQRSIAKWNDQSEVRNKDTFKRFQRELKSAGLTPERAPWTFLCMFSWHNIASKQWIRRYGKDEPPMGTSRVSGIIVPNESVERTLAYFNDELCQYKEHAFVSALEGLEYSEGGMMRTGSSWLLRRQNLEFDPLMIFGHVPRHGYGTEAKRVAILQQLHAVMLDGVNRLERGESWEPALFFAHKIRPDCYFQVVDPNRIGESLEKNIETEIFAFRARIVRLLGWPQLSLYIGVERALAFLREYCYRLFPIQGASYEMIDELSAYLRETERQYPILTAPFEL